MSWPTLPSSKVPEAMRAAVSAFEQGELHIAESLARMVLSSHPEQGTMWNLLGRLYLNSGRARQAEGQFQRALDAAVPLKLARANLQRAQAVPDTPEHRCERFLVSKAWGHGFWSDVDHFIGCALLAEVTGRTLVPHWGSNSLFREGPGTDDCFRRFFDCPAAPRLHDLANASATYYPSKWHRGNLLSESLNIWGGPGSQTGPASFIGRPETVAIADFHISLLDVLPWLPPGHRFEGMEIVDIYRTLVAEHLHPTAVVLERADSEAARLLAQRPIIAAHIRGSDKFTENRKVSSEHAAILDVVASRMSEHPAMGVLLITDSEPALRQFRARFGDRLRATSCTRTEGQVGVHLLSARNGYQIGVEVLVDAILAARCDYFVGHGCSNVSCAVLHLKAWEPGACTLTSLPMQHLPGFYKLAAVCTLLADMPRVQRAGGLNKAATASGLAPATSNTFSGRV